MREQRGSIRILSELPCYFKKSPKAESTICNISVTGAMIVTNNAIHEDDRVKLKIVFPDEHAISLSAVVRWVEGVRPQQAGVEFSKIAEEDRGYLNDFVVARLEEKDPAGQA